MSPAEESRPDTLLRLLLSALCGFVKLANAVVVVTIQCRAQTGGIRRGPRKNATYRYQREGKLSLLGAEEAADVSRSASQKPTTNHTFSSLCSFS